MTANTGLSFPQRWESVNKKKLQVNRFRGYARNESQLCVKIRYSAFEIFLFLIPYSVFLIFLIQKLPFFAVRATPILFICFWCAHLFASRFFHPGINPRAITFCTFSAKKTTTRRKTHNALIPTKVGICWFLF